MAKNNYSNPVVIEEAKVIFEEMAALADHGDQMCYHFGDSTNADALSQQLRFMRDLVKKLGMLADLGAGKLDGDTFRDGVEEWILPPSYKFRAELTGKEGQS